LPGPQPPPPGTPPQLDPPRPRRRKRRLIELGALLIVLPGLIGIQWYDDSNNAAPRDPHKHVVVVPRSAWATLGHTRWHMVGRRPDSSQSTTTPADTADVTLVLEAKVLDAKGGKELDIMEYELRDRTGRVWSADGDVESPTVTSGAPPVGTTVRVTVTGTVPRDRLSSVVLDVHVDSYDRPQRNVLDVLRFAH
jgi:hypothetical protein